MTAFTTLGLNTKTTFLHTENHKTTVEFTASAVIQPGQLVKLDAAGTISPWAATDLQHTCIGFAYNGAKAVGDLCTVWTRGYAIILGLSNAAQAAGPTTFASYDTTNATPDGNKGYNKYKVATDVTDCIGWMLDQATAANQLVRVLIKD